MNKPIYSIPAALPFSDVLARWILERYGSQPIALPDIIVLLPSRRACRGLREAFLRVTEGKATLLPRMQPLGDVDADRMLTLAPLPQDVAAQMPHPAFASRRLFLLARLIRAYQSNVNGKTERMDHALYQAHEIARLLDRVEREGASLAHLSTLAPERFASHWQLTTEFLHLVAEHWPAIAAEKGLVSAQEWRSGMVEALARVWKAHPPSHPVIVAGTTGSIPSTAQLLRVVADMPQGSVVLPGLDQDSVIRYGEQLSESHPYYGMRELLGMLEVLPQEVQDIGTVSAMGRERVRLLNRALCPPSWLSDWREKPAEAEIAVDGLSCIACADQHEEAGVIALLLRQALEHPGKTAALVTHDRLLARRVSAEMLRFGVQIDDSAGQPLSTTPSLTFLRLVNAVAQNNVAPVDLLALLKHPLAHAGMERLACLELARALEVAVLRGICPGYGLRGLRGVLLERPRPRPELHDFLMRLEESLQPLLAMFERGGAEEFSVLLETHLAAAEAIAGPALWQGREAESLSAWIDELRDTADDAERMEVSGYPSVFNALLVGRVVRPDYGNHPRLHILSPLESRMQSFDRIILGGLNEGSWPQEIAADPWFNQPMRQAMGLASAERQIGLAAHDFLTLASAPEVVLTRAEKVDGQPTSPARWWVRLTTLLTHYGVHTKVMKHDYVSWWRSLEEVAGVTPCAWPAPVPPLSARPKEVAVTQVERWLTNPYAFYAANVLKLRRLDEIDKEPVQSDFGTKVHHALQRMAEAYPSALPADPLGELLRYGREVFAPYEDYYPIVKAWWWPRFEQVAAWMIAQEKRLRPELSHVWAEVKGSFDLEGIRFVGRADRIEQTRRGELAIVDYKTGGAHSASDTRQGNAIQLMLLALMARHGQWTPPLDGRNVTRLEYWIAGGGRSSGEIRAVEEKRIEDYVTLAQEKLTRLVRHYQQADSGYRCSAAVGERYNDYEYLSRVQEWR